MILWSKAFLQTASFCVVPPCDFVFAKKSALLWSHASLRLYPSLSGAPRPPSLPSISADDSSSRFGSSICQKNDFKETLFITYHPLRALCTWAASKPHQRTAGFDGGCVWALSAPGSSSSGLPGWCWSPSVRSPASQRWPGDHTPQITGLHIGTLPWVRMVCWWSSVISHLQIDHVSGKRHLWIFSSVHGREAGLLDLLFHKPCLWGKNPPLKWPFPNAD